MHAMRPFRRVGALVSLLVVLVLATGEPVAAAAIPVKITSLPSVHVGWYAMASVKTRAGATCSIAVTYGSKKATSPGLTTRPATRAGTVAWRWKVPAGTPLGRWPVVVKCRVGQNAGSARAYLVVR